MFFHSLLPNLNSRHTQSQVHLIDVLQRKLTTMVRLQSYRLAIQAPNFAFVLARHATNDASTPGAKMTIYDYSAPVFYHQLTLAYLPNAAS